MNNKSKLKAFIENITNSYIYFNYLPTGINLFYDLQKSVKGYKAKTIFDVGANIGQSAEHFIENCPTSKIYCFEPVSSTFDILAEKFKKDNRINCYKFALGSVFKTSKIVITGQTNDCSYLTENVQEKDESEEVQVKTLDNFCKNNGITMIDFLKIDTEGNDLDVLRGAELMLLNKAIRAIQVEASMNSKNDRHVPFETFKSFFESKGYYLFKIYDQVEEDNSPIQRRSNPVFIPETVLKNN